MGEVGRDDHVIDAEVLFAAVQVGEDEGRLWAEQAAQLAQIARPIPLCSSHRRRGPGDLQPPLGNFKSDAGRVEGFLCLDVFLSRCVQLVPDSVVGAVAVFYLLSHQYLYIG